jgi:exodeoxyribonuclease VII large subunit
MLFKSALTISRYKQMLENIKSSLINLEKRLLLNCKNKIKMTMDKIENYDYRLTLLNPELILERGYSIIYDDDKKIVKDVSGFKVDDRIHLKLYRGNAEAKITKKS